MRLALVALLTTTITFAGQRGGPVCWSPDGVDPYCMTPAEMQREGMARRVRPDGVRCYALPNGAEVCRK